MTSTGIHNHTQCMLKQSDDGITFQMSNILEFQNQTV